MEKEKPLSLFMVGVVIGTISKNSFQFLTPAKGTAQNQI
jgi:hypothetical protein